MFLSSIFSFDTLNLRATSRGWLWSLIATLLLVFTGELVARQLMKPIGPNAWAYWSQGAMYKFETYRAMVHDGDVPSVVAIGDSTGARNFDPASFAETSGVNDAYNLAWPANFPLALAASTFPFLQDGPVPETVLVFQWAESFSDSERTTRSEQSILNSPIGQRYNGEKRCYDVLALCQLYLARTYLAAYWIAGEAILHPSPNRGFMPVQHSDDTSDMDPGVADRRLGPPVERRRDTVLRLMQLAQEKGFALIFVVGPSRQGSDQAALDDHATWLENSRASYSASIQVWKVNSFLALDAEAFHDNTHLRQEGAREFSRALGKKYRESLSQ